jgi:hypothetical protein
MTTGRTTQLTGSAGEFFVAAELCRLDLLATPFAGNVPHHDMIASGQSGGHLAVQVKAINGPTCMCVLVVLNKTRQDRFFVLEWTSS